MVLSFLYLVGIAIVVYYTLEFFLYDALGLIGNIFVYNRLKRGEYRRDGRFYAGVIVFTLFFSYFFLSIVASFLSWTIQKHPESQLMQIMAVTIITGVTGSLKSFGRRVVSAYAEAAYFPNVYSATFISILVFIVSILFLVFSPLMNKYWGWAPFVQ